MSLEVDYIVDRRKLKRRLSVWRILAIVLLAILVVTSISNTNSGNYIARLSVTGLIIDDIEREYALKNLKEDKEALALIVRIDSPGGTVVGGENLYYQLKNFGLNFF